jgi:hypothetical protein
MVALDNLLLEIDETLSRIDENDEKAKYQNIKQEFERKLQQLLFSEMEPDFYIEPEAEGNFIIGSGGVRIDFCMFPKHHLIENGFVQQWIGVEVKVPEPRKARAGKGGQVLWQSIIYSQSRFKVPKKPEEAGLANKTCVVIRPAFILIFPRLLKFFSSHELGFAFEAFAQQANVGSLDLLDEGWIMVGGTNYYFSRRSEELKLSTPNCLLKRNVGSKK